MAEEEWRSVELPRLEVSNLGNVRRADTKEPVTIGRNNLGYARVSFAFNVHRFVAQAFLGDPPKGREWVDHIDGDKANNRVENLRWVSPSENTYAYGHDNRIIHKRRKVKASHLDGREIVFSSRQAAAAYFGCQDSGITYGHRYVKHSRKSGKTDPNAHDLKGWIFERVEDIV